MPPERILLIRSGRHLRVAIDALRDRFPGCTIAVIATPGSERIIEQAGVAAGGIFIYDARPRFTPVSFAVSSAVVAARRWGFTRVAILWNDPEGRGQGNVDRSALVLAPRGFLAITPDGSVVERSPFRQLGFEARRAVVSLAVGAVLGALYPPAVALATARRVRSAATRRVRSAEPALQEGQGPAGPIPRSGPATVDKAA